MPHQFWAEKKEGSKESGMINFAPPGGKESREERKRMGVNFGAQVRVSCFLSPSLLRPRKPSSYFVGFLSGKTLTRRGKRIAQRGKEEEDGF